MVTLPFEELPNCFLGCLYHHTFVPGLFEGPHFFKMWPTCIVCFFGYSYPSGYNHISLWFCCISVMTDILNIFSHAYWPFIYHLWRNVCLNPLPILKLGCLVIVEFLMYSGCLLGTYSMYCVVIILIKYVICKYFLLVCSLSFDSPNILFRRAKTLNFDQVQCFTLLFYGSCFWCVFFF